MFIINEKRVQAPDGIIVKNFLDNKEPRFKFINREHTLRYFVIHETAGRTASGCKNTLLDKGYGVQLILDRDGTLSCHGDLLKDRMVHANQLNDYSIGIEVVNPYAPSLAKGMKDIETIPAQWWTWCPNKDDKRYVLPTKKQLDILSVIVPFLCYELNIPYVFSTLYLNQKQKQVITKDKSGRLMPEPGVVAHQDFAKHADGRYIIEYLASADNLD
jgi:hypothetical protein